ncbi:MAG: OmpA family protein [Burkholderiales bacterium]
MKIVKASGTIGFAVAAAFASPLAAAQDAGNYIGFGIGPSQAKIHDERISSQLAGSGFATTSIDDDDKDVAFKLFGGHKFNRNFAVEGGYFNLGKFGFTAHTSPAGTLEGSAKFQGANVDAVGILPLGANFSALARAGLTYAQTKDSFNGSGAVVVRDPSPSKNAFNYKFGLGAQYDFTPALGLRADWENYRVDDAVGNKGNINTFMLGLVYLFGKTQQPAPRTEAPPPVAAAPVAVAAAPVAEPVLVIVPIVAKTEQYCSILDIQFEINQNTVQRESEEKINKVGLFMTKYPGTTAVIEGHTDEVGTAADNMKLSERRAESVVTYLVDRSKIARSRLKAVGYGDLRPIGDNKTDAGKRLNRRINAVIACATDIEGIEAVPDRITMAMELEFDANSADVKPQYRQELRKVANFLKANPGVTATVEGHTGNLQGTPKLAMEISQRRAQNVVNYLVTEFEIPRARLAAEGFGQTRRFAYNTSAEGRQENRRVNIILDFPKK